MHGKSQFTYWKDHLDNSSDFNLIEKKSSKLAESRVGYLNVCLQFDIACKSAPFL